MKNRPGMKALEKTVVIKGSPQATSKAPAPPAKGAPVAPPPLWNYEGKPDPATTQAPNADASEKSGVRGSAAPAASAPAIAPGAVDEEELLALLDVKTAMDQMDVEIAAFAELVSRLPE